MMKVVYSEMDTPAGISCRLEAAGHAGYAPAGQDIVCAGASTVMQGLVCLLAGEESARSDAFDEPDGPRLAVQADAPCAEWVQGAFELAKACFALLAERYPENVRFADVSRRGEKSMMDPFRILSFFKFYTHLQCHKVYICILYTCCVLCCFFHLICTVCAVYFDFKGFFHIIYLCLSFFTFVFNVIYEHLFICLILL